MATVPTELSFRRHYAALVSALCGRFGHEQLELIEDAVQSAMLKAQQAWRRGQPDNPAAWLRRVATHALLDECRHRQIIISRQPLLGTDHSYTSTDSLDDEIDQRELSDDVLRLMFLLCRPELSQRTQIMMALKHLCGFSVGEIARGLLMQDEAVKKQLQRSARRLRDGGFTFDLPDDASLTSRLDAVHKMLYLTFNEGYSSTSSQQVIRTGICSEAAYLTHLLATHRLGNGDTRALLALMMSHAARLPARLDKDGETVLLEAQDRRLWDRDILRQASRWLASSSPHTVAPGRYQLEATISLLHGHAADLESTPWQLIIQCYDLLLRLEASPVYQVNRAIAVACLRGAEPALTELDNIAPSQGQSVPGIQFAKAWLLERNRCYQQALAVCQDALNLPLAPHEHRHILKQLRRLEVMCSQGQSGITAAD